MSRNKHKKIHSSILFEALMSVAALFSCLAVHMQITGNAARVVVDYYYNKAEACKHVSYLCRTKKCISVILTMWMKH